MLHHSVFIWFLCIYTVARPDAFLHGCVSCPLQVVRPLFSFFFSFSFFFFFFFFSFFLFLFPRRAVWRPSCWFF